FLPNKPSHQRKAPPIDGIGPRYRPSMPHSGELWPADAGGSTSAVIDVVHRSVNVSDGRAAARLRLHGEREDNLENVCDRLNRSAAASRQKTPVSILERARERRSRRSAAAPLCVHGEGEDKLENVCDRLNRSAAASRQKTPVSILERARDRRSR